MQAGGKVGTFGYARGGMTGAMSEEDMALGHKASRGETGLMGKFKKLVGGEVEWIPVTYQGEKFQFANTPETQKILSGSKFDSNEAFAQLVELGLMVPMESEGMQRGGHVGKFGY